MKFTLKAEDKCVINSIKLYGTPVLNTDNLFELYHKNEDKLKALAEMVGLKKPDTPPKSEQKQENEEGVTIEILPDEDDHVAANTKAQTQVPPPPNDQRYSNL